MVCSVGRRDVSTFIPMPPRMATGGEQKGTVIGHASVAVPALLLWRKCSF